MTLALAAASGGGKALWYLTRGTGAVTLVLLTLSVVLGVADVRRLASPRFPRFVVDGLHQTISLLVLATVAVHVITSVLDSFTKIRIVDALVPFVGSYRPLWLGLGALAFDMLLALLVTSLLRARLGFRAWRVVHWLAYACWPVAFLHALGTGSDVKSGWLLALALTCAALVAVAVIARLVGSEDDPRLRVAGFGLLAAAAVALAVWLPSGPLGRGWAKRAGTPVAALAGGELLAATQSGVAKAQTPPSQPALKSSVSANMSGRVSEITNPDGSAVVQFSLALDRGPARRLSVRLDGQALDGGGVALQSGEVTLGNDSSPGYYRGSVRSLEGGRLSALVRSGDGSAVRVGLALAIDQESGSASGSARLVPAGGGQNG